MQDSRLSGALACLLVRGGGAAELEGTFLQGSETGPGCRVCGAATQVSLSGCTLTDNGAPGLEVAEGAVVTLRDCLAANNDLFSKKRFLANSGRGGGGVMSSGRDAMVSGLGSRVIIGDGVEIGIGGAEEVFGV